MSQLETQINSKVFSAFLRVTPDALLILDESSVVRYWSKAAEVLTGVDGDFATDPIVIDLARNSVPENNGPGSANCIPGRIFSPHAATDGNEKKILASSRTMQVENETWKLVTLTDSRLPSGEISDLYRLAHTDPLTDLLNRRGFQTVLESHLDRPLAVAIVDVDCLKQINDEHGHEAGDEAIKLIARNLIRQFSKAAGVGRLGGDEFGVILELENQSQREIRRQFQELCEGIANHEFDLFSGRTTISIGVAVASEPGSPARVLLATADQAMYQAKQSGRNQVTVVPVATS